MGKIKDSTYYFLKDLAAVFRRAERAVKRTFKNTELKGEDFFSVPIIINNRNRLTFLRDLISWLENHGYKNIYIIDNDSTFPPLLDYYSKCRYKVFFLGRNVGYKALWLSSVFKQFKSSYYVYTDSDVLPGRDCPANIIEELYHVLKRFKNIEKAGPALQIDDIPDHYNLKAEVLKIEKEWWRKPVAPDVYDAPVDTTFALYKPYAEGNAEECKAYRLGGRFVFKHQPWYENSAHPTEEDRFYRESVAKGTSYWLNLK